MQLVAVARDPSGGSVSASVAWSSSATAVATVTSSGLVTAVAPGTAVITATATLGATSVNGTLTIAVAPAPVLTTVTVSGVATMVAGQTAQFTASPKDQNGSAITASVAWSASPASVAIITSGGLVTAVGPGSATVTASATAGGQTVTGSAALTVQAPPTLTTVGISPATSSVQVGTSLQLTASPLDQNGSPIAATITWSSGSPGIATVSATGLVTGVSAGTAAITVTAIAGGVTVTATRTITVTAAPPVLTSVDISAPTSTVNVGQTLQLTATPRDQNGDPIAASVNWSSSAAGIATVNSTGRVTGVSAGTADITALATLGSATASAFLTITVNSPAFPAAASVGTAGLSFNPATVDIAQGGTVTWTGLLGHNVTFTSPGSPANISGTSSDSRTFNTIGTFNYFCSIHGAGMSGSVVVH